MTYRYKYALYKPKWWKRTKIAIVKLKVIGDNNESEIDSQRRLDYKYRCNRAIVDRIVLLENFGAIQDILTCRSDWKTSFKYDKGEIVHEIMFDTEPKTIACTHGIHYCKTIREALELALERTNSRKNNYIVKYYLNRINELNF